MIVDGCYCTSSFHQLLWPWTRSLEPLRSYFGAHCQTCFCPSLWSSLDLYSSRIEFVKWNAWANSEIVYAFRHVMDVLWFVSRRIISWTLGNFFAVMSVECWIERCSPSSGLRLSFKRYIHSKVFQHYRSNQHSITFIRCFVQFTTKLYANTIVNKWHVFSSPCPNNHSAWPTTNQRTIDKHSCVFYLLELLGSTAYVKQKCWTIVDLIVSQKNTGSLTLIAYKI